MTTSMSEPIHGLSEVDVLMLADLDRIAKLVGGDVLLSREIWTYLGGPKRMEYNKFCQLVRLKHTDMISKRGVAHAMDILFFNFGPVFEHTTSLPDNVMAKKYTSIMDTGKSGSVLPQIPENERFMLVDITRMQLILSGDHLISIRDELYEYLKAAERCIQPERFSDLVRVSINMVPDDPSTSEENAMHLIKQRFGEDFKPTCNLPNEEFLSVTGIDNPRKGMKHNHLFLLYIKMETNWLGETRPGRVGKMKPEQIRLMVAVIDAVRCPYSDYFEWDSILKKTGLDKHGATEKQLKDKYFHLTRMNPVNTVEDYENYNTCEEPGGLTWREMQNDKINFTYPTSNDDDDESMNGYLQRRGLILPRRILPDPPLFSSAQWRRVLGSIPDHLSVPGLSESDWKGIFNACGIPNANITGRQIMHEFYGLVVPHIRDEIFGQEGRNTRLLLRGNHFCNMMVIVGAINEPWDEDAIYSGIRRLHEQEIISFAVYRPMSFWGEVLFDYLKDAQLENFKGNKANLYGLKSYWRMMG